jgi:DNA-binding NarL/FixJ family response regulator
VIRVLLAEDHALVRAGVERLLATVGDIEVVGSAANGAEAVALASEHRPDVVLMDISMPELNGVEATRRIVAENEGVNIVVLTSFADRQEIEAALDAGRSGICSRTPSPRTSSVACVQPPAESRRSLLEWRARYYGPEPSSRPLSSASASSTFFAASLRGCRTSS